MFVIYYLTYCWFFEEWLKEFVLYPTRETYHKVIIASCSIPRWAAVEAETSLFARSGSMWIIILPPYALDPCGGHSFVLTGFHPVRELKICSWLFMRSLEA